MPQSTYIFESGDAIEIGSHGETDYVYQSGDPVTNTPNQSPLVFESGVSLGSKLRVIEDFEDGSAWTDAYSGDTGAFDATSSDVQEGTYAGIVTSANKPSEVISTDSDKQTQRGENYRYWVKTASSDTDNGTATVLFYASSGGAGYFPSIENYDNTFELNKTDGSGATTLGTVAVAIDDFRWYEVEFSGRDDGTIDIFIYDDTGKEIVNQTYEDDTYSSGGVGIRGEGAGAVDAKVDYVRQVA